MEPTAIHTVQMQREAGQGINIAGGRLVVISLEKLVGRPANDGESSIAFSQDNLKKVCSSDMESTSRAAFLFSIEQPERVLVLS